MAYSNFTLDKVIETFELDIVDSEDLFAEVETDSTGAPSQHGVGAKGSVSGSD